MNCITFHQEVLELVEYLKMMLSPDTVSTFISPSSTINCLIKKIRYGYKQYSDIILNELVIFLMTEIKHHANPTIIYCFHNWQKDKFRYIDDEAFLEAQKIMNHHVLNRITGTYKDRVTLDLSTIIYSLFPAECKKKVLNQYIWYSILLLAQAYFIITQESAIAN